MKEYNLIINGNSYSVVINEVEETMAEVEVNGTPYQVTIDKPLKKIVSAPATRAPRAAAPSTARTSHSHTQTASTGGSYTVNSPLPGVILEVSVKEGDTVKAGQKLIVLEAMKMENNIEADRDGVVATIKVNKGDSVLEGAPLIILN
ncbi:MAG: biotin/lipoyl-containing protein [Bacteroidales bacterium]|jgi:biotin carboxyl carrier protein|nr:biotin/lipoyl-binding protein [Bacteroidales bacterium]MDD2824619.1 biotin/lipoyl-binding protein [Bacteroidales bacterium]MDD3100288.1 biotin/lipoyl-binding protein [Bacteroidales bacterium]MDD3639100.1 biotin/lipoyl-binding protein [Bacteroidales bacterium]MDD3943659.1 biotin/lipoyl-binding protein [Bacteroidales bacterium]